MSRLSNVLDLLTGNASHLRKGGKPSRSRLLQRRHGSLGMRHFRLEPLEERTLLSFTAMIEQAAGADPFPALVQPDPTNAAAIRYEVTFGSDINPATFDGSDISFAGSTIHGGAALTPAEMANLSAAITPVAGDSKHFIATVAVVGSHIDWDIKASILAERVRTTGLDTNAASTSVDNQVRFDNIAPTVTINQKVGQVDPAIAGPILFTAVFSEAVTDFDDLTDVTVSAGAVTGITEVGPMNGTTYEVAVGDLTHDALVTATIGAGVATDAAGNANLVSTSTDNEVGYNLPLAVQVGQADGILDPTHSQADPTNNSTVHFTAVFNEPINPATFATTDVVLTFGGGGSGVVSAVASVAGADNKVWDITVTMGHVGTVSAGIPAGVVQDMSGELNPLATFVDNTVTYATAAPTVPSVTINRAAGQAATVDSTLPIKFTAVFSEKVTDFDDLTDVTLNAEAVAAGAAVTKITQIGTDGKTYEIEVGGLTADATVTATIAAGVAIDVDSNGNIHSTTAAVDSNTVEFNIPLTVTVEQIPPPAQPDPTNIGTILFRATFSEDIKVDSFTAADVKLTGTALGASVDSLTMVGGDSKVWNIAVKIDPDTNNDGVVNADDAQDGTVIVSIDAAKVQDNSGENNAASTSDDNVVTYDMVKPGVTVNQTATQVDPINGSNPVQFVAVFNEPIDDTTVATAPFAVVDADTVTYGDITLHRAPGSLSPLNLAGLTVTALKVDSQTYIFSVSGFGAGQYGTLSATMAANAVTDKAGNLNVASTFSDNTVEINNVTLTPTVALATGQAASVNTLPTVPINFTVTFNKPVTDFDDEDVNVFGAVTGSAFAMPGAVATAVVTGIGTTYNVEVLGMAKDGSVTLNVLAGSAHDVYGNVSVASAPGTDTVAYDRPFTADVEQAAGQLDPTNLSTINFTAEFGEQPVDFVKSKVDLSDSTAPGTLAAKITGGGWDSTTNSYNYNIAVTGMTGDGTVVASVFPGVVHNAGWQVVNVLTPDDNEVAYTNAPTVTINQAATQTDPTGAATINFTAVFSQAMTGFTAGDVVVDRGTDKAFPSWGYGYDMTPIVVVTDLGDHKTFNIAISGMPVDGDVIATIPEGVAQNSTGKTNLGSTSLDNIVNYIMPLTVTINQAAGQADPTSTAPIHFTATFAEPVDNFSIAGVSLEGSTASEATVQSVTKTDGYGLVYDIAVGGMTATGTVVASVLAGAASHNPAHTNPNLASTSTDNLVAYDADDPLATITPPAGPVTGSPISFAVHFNENVTGFEQADVTLGGTALGVLAAATTGSGQDYTINVIGMTNDGTVTVAIKADAVADLGGNGNPASAVATATYDMPNPAGVLVGAVATTSGTWYRDLNGNQDLDAADEAAKIVYGSAGAVPVVGDWNGDGKSEVGVYALNGSGQGIWYLDVNGNGVLDDAAITYGATGDIPVVGDWNGDGKSEVGVYYVDSTGQGMWTLDGNGNGVLDAADMATQGYHGWRGATPVVGDWNGDGKSEIGVYAVDGTGQGMWYLDVNGNRWWDSTDAAAKGYHGWVGATPVVGDWNGDGKSEIGVYAVNSTDQGVWYPDVNGNRWWDSADASAKIWYGRPDTTPVVGKWNGGSPLQATSVVAAASGVSSLTQDDLQPIVREAAARWAAADLDATVAAKLAQVQFVISDLADAKLGDAGAGRVYLDINAAGHGWFIDSTPALDEEFVSSSSSQSLRAVDSRAVDRIDLLTVVEHELGHIAGFDDLDALADNLMSQSLGTGVRRNFSQV